MDTPPGLNPHGCSLHPRSLGRESPKGLPGPTQVSSRVFIAVEYQSTGVADRGTYRETFPHQCPTSTALLTGVSGFTRNHVLTGACGLVRTGGRELRPASIAPTLGQVAVPHQVGNPQIFAGDRVVVTDQVQRHRVVNGLSLSPDFLGLLGAQLARCGAALAALLPPTDATRRCEQCVRGPSL